MDTAKQRFSSRKFFVAINAQMVGHVALFMGILDPTTWMQLQGAIIGLYGLANVGQSAVKQKNGVQP